LNDVLFPNFIYICWYSFFISNAPHISPVVDSCDIDCHNLFPLEYWTWIDNNIRLIERSLPSLQWLLVLLPMVIRRRHRISRIIRNREQNWALTGHTCTVDCSH